MTDTLQTPLPTPDLPPPRPRPNALAAIAVFAVAALALVAIVAMARRDGGTAMMDRNGMPGSMMGGGQMGGGQMMNGQMMNGQMMDHGTSSPVIPGAREIAVVGTGLRFDPAEIRVRAGESVTIVLTAGDIAHDFTIDELGFHVAAIPGAPGRGSFTAPAATGRYTAYCSVPGHRQAGMTATVVVDE